MEVFATSPSSWRDVRESRSTPHRDCIRPGMHCLNPKCKHGKRILKRQEVDELLDLDLEKGARAFGLISADTAGVLAANRY